MEANTEFDLDSIDRGFLKFCEEQDRPVVPFERWKSELYFRAIGYSKKPIPEIDRQFICEDLTALERGVLKSA